MCVGIFKEKILRVINLGEWACRKRIYNGLAIWGEFKNFIYMFDNQIFKEIRVRSEVGIKKAWKVFQANVTS